MRKLLASLRIRLLLLVLLAVVPMLALVLHSYAVQMRAATVGAQANALALARLAANDQEHLIEGARQLLVVLAELPSVQDQDAAVCSSFLADLLKEYPLYENLGAANLEGDIFCSAVPSATRPNMSDRPWFQRALETRDFVVGDYLVARITGRPTMGTVYPVLDDVGQPQGVVFAGIDLAWLDSFVANAQLQPGSSLAVVDSTGTILTHYPDPERWRGKSLPDSVMQPLRAHLELVNEAQGVDGVRRLYGTTRLSSLPAEDVFVRVGIPTSVVYADAQQLLIRNLATLGLASLLVVGAVWGGARFFVLDPLNALMRAIKRFKAGDSGARVGDKAGSGELGYVGQAFDEMAAEMAGQLGGERARVRALLEMAQAASSTLELDEVVSRVADGIVAALGVDRCTFHLVDEEQRSVLYFRQPSDWSSRVLRSFDSYGSAFHEVLTTGEPLVSYDVLSDPRFPRDKALEVGYVSALGVPLLVKGRVIAEAWAYTVHDHHRFTPEEVALAQGIGNLLGLVIRNAQLYEQSKLIAVMEERARLGREIHDGTAQTLGALQLKASQLEDALSSERVAESQGYLSELQTMISRAYRDLREAMLGLRAVVEPGTGLVAALREYLAQYQAQYGLEVCLEANEEEPAILEGQTQAQAMRIVQEALRNVFRHAGTDRVTVSIERYDDSVRVCVVDEGRGFDRAHLEGRDDGRHLGLRTMRERAESVGGTLTVESLPGQGTSVVLEVPLSRDGGVA
jgi:nitrate/nitrite-specific signal transduction histidine kinase